MSNPRRMRALSFNQAVANAENSPALYVMNKIKPEGNINLTAKGDDGVMTTVVIPMTFIPFDMSLVISRESLLGNQAFRRMLARGDVIIVHPEDAENAISSTPSAQRELKKILSANQDLNGASGNESEGGFVEMAGGSSPDVKKNTDMAKVSPFAMGIVQRASAGEDSADLISDLESRSTTLELADFEFIMQGVEDAALKQFVIDHIDSLQS